MQDEYDEDEQISIDAATEQYEDHCACEEEAEREAFELAMLHFYG